MRGLLLGLTLAALPLPAHSQQVTNLYAAGVSVNPGATPTVAGTGLFARKITDAGTYAFTVVDALPTTVKPYTVTTQFGAGVAQRVVTIGKMTVYVPTSAGVSYNGTNTGWAWTTGALGSIAWKGNWRLLPHLRVVKSSVSNGTGYQLIGGVLLGWAQ